MDPTREEHLKCDSQLAIWSLPALGTVTSMSQVGALTPEEIDSVSYLSTQCHDDPLLFLIAIELILISLWCDHFFFRRWIP